MDNTVWRWFPHGLAAAMGLVFLVNGYMVYSALHTFPGQAGQDGFDLSNEYAKVLSKAQQQAALGWQVDAGDTPAHKAQLRLADRNGQPLAGVTIEAQAERPVGPPETTSLAFNPVERGLYRSDTTLTGGQWDIMLTVHAGGHQYTATRRVVVN